MFRGGKLRFLLGHSGEVVRRIPPNDGVWPLLLPVQSSFFDKKCIPPGPRHL